MNMQSPIPCPLPPLPDGEGHREAAREYLTQVCRLHGAQTELARRCDVITPYINRLVKQPRAVPSLALAAALEREIGLPAGWWRVERWTRVRAASVIAGQRTMDPYPGYMAKKVGVSPERLDDIMAGREPMPVDGRWYCFKNYGIPREAWDV